MSLIELRQVSKIYAFGEVQIRALHAVDLRIRAGEFAAVWGPSGSGKTTLCNLIGLLDAPSSGRVLLQGKDTSDLSDDELTEMRNRSIGFIFQSFNLVPVLSALENVILPLQIQGASTRQVRSKAAGRLEELGLGPHLGRRPHKLSGGQQQRVAIARALIADPALVIADEPTANLDSRTALSIIEMMRELNSRNGTTFLLSTHDQRLLERVDRRLQLRDGTIVRDEGTEGPGAPPAAGDDDGDGGTLTAQPDPDAPEADQGQPATNPSERDRGEGSSVEPGERSS